MQAELKEIADLALFARVVQAGGISRCASILGMERTTVSRRIGMLEKTLGVKLLDRSPRHTSITDAGYRCLRECERILDSAAKARSLATEGSVRVNSHPVIIGAPPDIMHRYLEPMLAKFEALNPSIRTERNLVTTWTGAAVESVDLGIGLAPVHVEGIRSSKIASVRQSVFASAEYVSSHEPVTGPRDLRHVDCIVERDGGENRLWRFRVGDRITSVAVNQKYVVSTLLESREAALAGLGACRLPIYLCEEYLNNGRLVDLFPDVESTGRDVVLISPYRRQHRLGVADIRIHLERTFATTAL